jgi:hypothetical protein
VLATLIATIAVFGIVMLAMAIGVLFQGKRLRGSCGATGKDCECSPLAARACKLREMRESASS